MKVFVAGASGAVGRRLVPLLVAGGHEVVASTRSADNPRRSRSWARPRSSPTASTALAGQRDRRGRAGGRRPPDDRAGRRHRLPGFDDAFALTNRLRTEGTDHLLAGRPRRRGAARRRAELRQLELRAPRRPSRPRTTRSTPIRPSRCARRSRRSATSRPPCSQTAGVEGIALRYANLYGPAHRFADDGDIVAQVRKRTVPIVGTRRRRLVVRARRRRRRGDARGDRARPPRRLQRRRRRARERADLAARARRRRSAPSRRATCPPGSAASPPARPRSRCSPRSAAPPTSKAKRELAWAPRHRAGATASGASSRQAPDVGGAPSYDPAQMLYGRDAERSRIGEILDGARESRSAVLVIRGEAGVGKSALLEDARAQASGMRVLRGRGIESEAQLPYAGLHQLLRPVLGDVDELPRAAGARAARRARARGRRERRVVPRLARRPEPARRGRGARAAAVPRRRRALARRRLAPSRSCSPAGGSRPRAS